MLYIMRVKNVYFLKKKVIFCLLFLDIIKAKRHLNRILCLMVWLCLFFTSTSSNVLY